MDTSASAWSEYRRVLCIRLDTIGDVLMTTPAIRALSEQCTDRRITLLTSRPGALAGALVPEVDRVIAYDAPWMKASSSDDSPWRDCAMVERLRACDFDAAVIFTTFSQSPLPAALMCHLAGIPTRRAHCRENPYHLLSEWVREIEPEQGIRHEVKRQFDLVASIGASTDRTGLSLSIPPDATIGAIRRLREAGHDPAQPWIVLHPGATAESRRYPPELYAEAMRRLGAETTHRIVVTGTQEERAAAILTAELGDAAVSLTGSLAFEELCGLIAAAPLLISNNTGPVHIAAAVGTPVVDVYALTNPQHTPWQVPSRVLSHDVSCRWCFRSVCPEGHHRCLRMVSPADVAQAALDLLDEVSPEQSRLATIG